MTEIVFKHGGTLDKYVGDAVMVLGDPIPQDDHAERAVSMALEMLERMRSLEDHWYRRYDQVFEIGIGIATGWVTVGDIGSRSFRLHRAGQPGEPGVATRRQGERAPDPRDRADDGRGRTPRREARRRDRAEGDQSPDQGLRGRPEGWRMISATLAPFGPARSHPSSHREALRRHGSDPRGTLTAAYDE